MPLKPGKDQATISGNIAELHRADPSRSNAQDAAIAYNKAGIYRKKKKKAGGIGGYSK